jgi:O-antigen/teichoic acid export membrane protein
MLKGYSRPRHGRKRSGGKQVGALTIASLAAYGAGALTGPILSQALGSSGRGEVAAALTTFAVLLSVSIFGLDASGAYFVREKSREEVMQAAWVWAIGVTVPISLLGWFLVGPFFSGRPSSVLWSFRALLVLLPLIVLVYIACEVELNLNGVSLALLLVQFGPLFFNAIAVVGLAIIGQLTLVTALSSAFVSQLITVVLGFFILRIRLPRGHSSHTTIPMFKFGALGAIGTISFVLVGRLDQIMMVKLVSSSTLGVYAVAANVMIVNAAASGALGRWGFGKIRSSSEPAVMLKRLLRIAGLQSIVLAVAAAVVSPFALPMLFGPEFKAAVPLVYLLLPGQVCLDGASVLVSSLLAMGRPLYASLSRVSGAVLSAVTLYPVLNRHGAEGAAIVTSASGFLVLLSSIFFYLRISRSIEGWRNPSRADNVE